MYQKNPSEPKNFNVLSEAYLGDGIMVNSEFLNGLKVNQAINKIIIEIEKRKIGERKQLLDLKIGVFPDKDTGAVQFQ